MRDSDKSHILIFTPSSTHTHNKLFLLCVSECILKVKRARKSYELKVYRVWSKRSSLSRKYQCAAGSLVTHPQVCLSSHCGRRRVTKIPICHRCAKKLKENLTAKSKGCTCKRGETIVFSWMNRGEKKTVVCPLSWIPLTLWCSSSLQKERGLFWNEEKVAV